MRLGEGSRDCGEHRGPVSWWGGSCSRDVLGTMHKGIYTCHSPNHEGVRTCRSPIKQTSGGILERGKVQIQTVQLRITGPQFKPLV